MTHEMALSILALYKDVNAAIAVGISEENKKRQEDINRLVDQATKVLMGEE